MSKKKKPKQGLGLLGWASVSAICFLVALWSSFMVGEMAVNWTDVPAWPAKTFLCSADTTPEIVRTSEAGSPRGHESTHSNDKWELVCHGKSGDKRPSGVFWVQIGTWLLLFFPPFLLIGYFLARLHRRYFPQSWPE